MTKKKLVSPHGANCYCDGCVAHFQRMGAQLRSPLKIQARLYREHPPKGTADDQTVAFTEVLKRLYQIEDFCRPAGPMARDLWGKSKMPPTFAEARAICERHLPVTLVAIMRKRHGGDNGDEERGKQRAQAATKG